MTRKLLIGALVAGVLALCAAPAQAQITIDSFKTTSSSSQAGGHPDLTTEFELKGPGAPEAAKNVIFNAPEGVFGNPNAMTRCTASDFALHECPVNSQAGVITVRANHEGNEEFLLGTAPIYDIIPIKEPHKQSPRFALLLGSFVLSEWMWMKRWIREVVEPQTDVVASASEKGAVPWNRWLPGLVEAEFVVDGGRVEVDRVDPQEVVVPGCRRRRPCSDRRRCWPCCNSGHHDHHGFAVVPTVQVDVREDDQLDPVEDSPDLVGGERRSSIGQPAAANHASRRSAARLMRMSGLPRRASR